MGLTCVGSWGRCKKTFVAIPLVHFKHFCQCSNCLSGFQQGVGMFGF